MPLRFPISALAALVSVVVAMLTTAVLVASAVGPSVAISLGGETAYPEADGYSYDSPAAGTTTPANLRAHALRGYDTGAQSSRTRPAAPASALAARGGGGLLRQAGRRLADERGSIGNNIAFGHGARHLAATGLRRSEVEAVIEQQVRRSTTGATVGGPFGGRVTVGGQTIEYRGYGLPDGRINIGTYYPIR